MNTVYVINKGGHNFTPAEKYGKLTYLTEGVINPFSIDKMYREVVSKLKDSKPDDFILITGLTIINSIACACFARKHDGRLNLLLYKNERYISRTVMIDQLL